jgi:DNA-directed RNA polymerase specialized sigma24 family protein
MIVTLKNIAPRVRTHADLFMDRYNELLERTSQLTGHDRGRAEDLLHDAFVQFTCGHADLSAIHDVDRYLFGIIRHLHLSNVRRAMRSINGLPIIEYDSAESGLRVKDACQQMVVSEQLRAICRYACARKETAKAGSVLILRFFHGYYPEEIAHLLRVSHPAIKEQIRYARSEARLYIEDPGRLTFMRDSSIEATGAQIAKPSSDLLTELRSAIFRCKSGPCLSAKNLSDLYLPEEAVGPTCSHLAHIVSCRRCLDEANGMLGLPLIAERYAPDTIGNGSRKSGRHGGPPKNGTTSGDGADRDKLRKSLRRAKEVFEHEPRELFIAVNGYRVGSQEVSSDQMVQTHTVQIMEPVGFVEIFSEQEVRMLMLEVSPLPEGEVVQSARSELSGERTLEVSLDFSGAWPTVQVIYRDPQMKPEQSTYRMEMKPRLAVEQIGESEVGRRRVRAAEAPSSRSLDRWRAPFRGGWVGLFQTKRIPVIALFVLVFVAALVLYTRMPGRPDISAPNLLGRSKANEETLIARPDEVVHRTFYLEKMRSAGGGLISRHRIEVWQSGEKKTKARRVYDESDRGRMISGEWTRPDGSRIVYERGMKLSELPPATASDKIGDVWQIDPSAADFLSIVGGEEGAAKAKVESRTNAYAITYSPDAGPESGSQNGGQSKPLLTHAVLVLSRSDLHATEASLVLQQGDELREYRFVETSFERRPSNAVAPAVFEPEPELIGKAGVTTTPSGAPAKVRADGPTAPSPVIAVASAELEIRVLELLSRIGADLGQEVMVSRTPDGPIKLEAAVETERRKREILSALSPIASHPAVRLEIETVAEAQERTLKRLASQPGGVAATSIRVATESIMAKESIPAQAEVRRYLAAKGIAGQRMDEEMSRFVNDILVRDRRAKQHAWALVGLADRFSPEDLRTLDPDAKRRRLAMIRSHAQAYRMEVRSLREVLDAIFGQPSSGAESQSAGAISQNSDDGDVSQSIKVMVNLATVAHEGIIWAFTIGSGKPVGSVPLKAVAFLHSLSKAEQISEGLARMAVENEANNQ